MRNLSSGLADHLASGVTTLCHAWRIRRRDGVDFGFTDHDGDLTFGGVTYAAATGLDASQAEASLGLSVGGSEISGALDSTALRDDDLSNGLFDGASVEIWLVNWADPSLRELLDAGSIGEVTRTEHAFSAEVRSLAHQLDQSHGRLYQSGCSADLGDDRCGVSLATSSFSISGETSAASGRLEVLAALGDFADGWFTGGRLTFVSGANANVSVAVKEHRAAGETHLLSLWTAVAHPVAAGDHFSLTTGCDKSFATCRTKFANQSNFRGFPHMPGNDVVSSYPSQGDPNMDGGSLFR